MTLSLKKMQNILHTKGFLIKKVFVINKKCIYIEVVDVENVDVFLINVPEKYNIFPDIENEYVYKIQYVDVKNNGEISEHYTDKQTTYMTENNYVMKVKTSTNNDDDMVNNLENDYNTSLLLTDINDKDNTTLSRIYRQLRRLRLCVKGLIYTLCIMYKNYICCV